MDCSCCGEIIEPEDILSDELCDKCFNLINLQEEDIEEEFGE